MQPPNKKSSFNPFLDTVRQGAATGGDWPDAQLRILKLLTSSETAGLGDVIKLAGLPPVEGMKLVHEMEDTGLVSETTSAGDGTVLQLTPDGKAVAAALMAS